MQPLSVEEVVTAFIARLNARSLEIGRIASFWNSFEGWLKFELALHLYETSGRRPWTDQADSGEQHTIGVEWKAITKPTRSYGLTRKQIDLWVCSSSRERWHCVELKVVFNNRNAAKQVASWLHDLDALTTVTGDGIDGRIVLLVAIGFEESTLTQLVGTPVTTICEATGAGADGTPSVRVVSRSS
jgi:hypothetical protein